VRPNEELSCGRRRWRKCSKPSCIAGSDGGNCRAGVGRMKMLEKVVMIIRCRRIKGNSTRDWSNRLVNGREIYAATHVSTRWILLTAAHTNFLLRFKGKLQAFRCTTHRKSTLHYSFHIVSVHLKIGYCVCTSELYCSNVICLRRLLFRCCYNVKSVTSPHNNTMLWN